MELLTTPTADDWDGNIVISDMEEPNREEGGRWKGCYPISSRRRRVNTIAEFQNHWKGPPAGKVQQAANRIQTD